MIHSKSHKPGVTFIEIMLTIFMMGMILSSAFISQSTMLAQIGTWSRSLRSTLAVRELFIHTAQDRMLGKKHPATSYANLASGQSHDGAGALSDRNRKDNIVLTYAIDRPKKDSSLAKLEDINIEKAQAVWGEQEEKMISLLYKPEEKKKP